MKIGIISDAHFSTSHRYGLLDLKLGLFPKVLKHLAEKSDMIISLGDGYDARAYNSMLATRVAECWHRVQEQVNCFELTGNHDVNYEKYHPLSPYALDRRFSIVSELREIDLPNSLYGAVLQGWSGSEILKPHVAQASKCFYFGHVQVADWLPNSKGATLAELRDTGYRKYFLGDFHEHKVDGNVISVGTLFPSSFSDADYQAGYLIFDTETEEFKRFTIPPCGYPIFKKFVVTPKNEEHLYDQMFNDETIRHNIVRVYLEGPSEWLTDNLMKRINELRDFEPRHFEIKQKSISKHQDIKSLKTEKINKKELLKEEMEIQGWSEEIYELSTTLIGE